ncbi:tRNA (guanine(10)-N2)-methyltransferase homolog [Episyrphus balteatus]|uniref:tRNA (guanine(10)-N2)-methyltransferase homolog n=1 Tax=Episyrphus balteatus TaxID=286459 RepID=UPI0024860201|nr:tRNA (guanine(10)-N2)-methyltransferase homolog [Episyrphus balteatus]
MNLNWRKYILWFAQEHVDFRAAEIESIVKLFDLKFNKLCEDSLKPYWIVELPNEETAIKLASRSVLLRCILELWSHSTCLPEFHKNLRQYVSQKENNTDQYFQNDRTFKINIETYNKHFTQKEKVEKIETFDYLPLEGQVDLKNPNVEWWNIEFYGLNPQEVPDQPDDVFFGRLVANGQRHLIKEFSLKKRKFIGNTSMDAQLSLLMANQAKVQPGDLVFDPFVGTGSLLVSAAKFGGFVMGADIDYMMLHARARPSRITQKVREKDESIWANLKQYGCEKLYIDVVVSDFSNPLWRDAIKFDSIITDPPYGIRESIEKIETKTSNKQLARNEDVPHYPSTSQYALQDLFSDLLSFAAKHLRMDGRLVCWVPFHREDYSKELLPRSKHLELVANSEQPLTGQTSRRLLTYQKISEPMDDSSPETELIEFRERYFDSGIESRTERRTRRAELREIGRQEALKRGKVLKKDAKTHKTELNKNRRANL